MSKQKNPANDFLIKRERVPQRERAFVDAKKHFASLASFYGFEMMHMASMEEYAPYVMLEKMGMLSERMPVLVKGPKGLQAMLRLSGALSLIRAYASARLNDLPHPLKLCFEGDIFYSSPDSGEIQGYAEWGVGMFGEQGPVAEAQILQVIWQALKDSNMDEASLLANINAVGCKDCRPSYRSNLNGYLRSRAYRFCKECKKHLKDTPTKIFACKEEQCRLLAADAPQVLDYLCEACKKHLRGILEFLDEARIPYVLEPRLFKDGRWFGSFVFEISEKLSQEQAGARILAEGGRMTKAAELVIGKPVEVVCGTIFLENIEEAMRKRVGGATHTQIFLVQLGELAKKKSLPFIEELRKSGFDVKESLGRDSVQAQLKMAETMGAEIAIILGQKEALEDTAIVREVSSGVQETVPHAKLIEFLRRKLKKQ